MKLSEVVRGVEVKEFDKEPDYTSYSDGVVVGNNSLAQAEVVVDREKIEKMIGEYMSSVSYAKLDGVFRYNPLANQIATAIESGAIISLKEG